MKKIILLFTLISVVLFLNAQSQGCSPDPQYSAAGVYPDSATNLSTAYVGQSYSENITLITPNDTDVVLNAGFPAINVTIDSIVLLSVTGLPNNFNYACNPSNCSFEGGTTACAELYSTSNPTPSDIGVYPIVFETRTYASDVPIVVTTTQDDVIDYYYLEISNTTSTFNMINNFTFELKEVYPNPVVNNANIQFMLGSNKDVVFSIYNLLGVEIETRILNAQRGVNNIPINTISYPDGIYLYSINDGYNNLTKRMIVKN